MSDGSEYEDPGGSVCTEFAVEDGVNNESGEEAWAWSFECARCGHMTPCGGDPRGFGGRPYSCTNCGWVSLLEEEAIESFAEECYVSPGAERSEGGGQSDE